MTNFPPHHRTWRDGTEQSRRAFSSTQNLGTTADRVIGNMIPIDKLSDAILLEIFASYVNQSQLTIRPTKRSLEAWQMLVHVCQRWRSIVFASPHRLNLQLVCTPETPANDKLDIWPAFPLVVIGYVSEMRLDNIIAVLRRNGNRVCQIDLDGLTKPQLDEISTVTLGRYPELRDLRLGGHYDVKSFDNKSFLGGPAPPHLQSLSLDRIPLLRLPKLLSSASQLVHLRLSGFPISRNNLPKALATALSALTRLQSLDLTFRPPRSRSQWSKRRRQPSTTRLVLPALTKLSYLGVHKYLEDLVSHIEAPQLIESGLSFFEDKELLEEVDLDAPQFARFIDRAPKMKARDEAHVHLGDFDATIRIPLLSPGPTSPNRELTVDISDGEADWKLSSLGAVCASFSPFISTVENLYIKEDEYWQQAFYYFLESWRWLDVLLPFTAVKNLYLPGKSTRDVMPALQVVVEQGIRGVLPKLENIFMDSTEVSGRVLIAIGLFNAVRRDIGQPVTLFISDGDWDRNKFTKVE